MVFAKRFKLPLIFFISGFVVKTTLCVLWRLYQSAGIMKCLVAFDPIGYFCAYNITSLFSMQCNTGLIGIVPAYYEAIFFEMVLVVIFAVECFILGLVTNGIICKTIRNKNFG
jgi:hypothetical protein